MRTHTIPLRSATAAIAAVLALGSTPLLAQAISPTGDPVILTPAPAAPAPVVVAPAPVTTTAPVVQSLPSDYVPSKAAAPAVPPSAVPSAAPASRATAPVRAPAARAAAAPAAAAPSMSAANDTAPVAAPIDEAAAPVTDANLFPPSETAREVVTTPEPAARAVDDLTILAAVIGVLALLAFGWLGWILRRRRTADRVAAPRVTRPVVTPRAEPIAPVAAAPVIAQEPIAEATPAEKVIADPIVEPQLMGYGVEETPAIARAETSFGAPRWAERPATPIRPAQTKGALPSNGASVDLPARAPESFEERDALLKRMIAAKPDKANPFTDRKARTKRARLIIQSLDRDFAHTDPWIDLSQYPNNWPELARRRFPQAA